MQTSLKTPTWTTKHLAEKPQMQALWAAVEEDTGNPLLVHFLARLIEIQNVPARDPKALARAVQLYSARKIKFFRERPERFQSAMRTVAWGIGDCDDKARFIAASLRTFRIPVQLKFLHITLPNGAVLGHVYPLAWLPGKSGRSTWQALESTREYPLGYDPETKALAKGFKIKTTRIGDKGEDLTHI
jgi:hypothetical protein